MSPVPRHATTYTIDVPDEEAARAVAQVLVERGHTVVRVARKTAGHGSLDRFAGSRWRVTGLDEGPYPDDDEHWWPAAEKRAVSDLVAAHGGGCTRSQAEPVTARRLLADGEIVADRTVEQVRDVRVATLSQAPARIPAPAIVHRLRTPEPSAGPTGEPIALTGLDDVDWAAHSHAYGSAEDVPDLLLRLAANDEGWDEAMYDYYSAVVHQGTCYDCTPLTIGFLVQLACAPQLVSAYRLQLLIDLAYVAALDPGPACEEAVGAHPSARSASRQEITDHLPALLALWPEISASARAWLIVLAAWEPAAATGLLPDFQAFRRQVEGPSPALDLALALVAGDVDAALDLTINAAAWDEQIPDILEDPQPLRGRHLRVLIRLATAELAPAQ
jgi:hypothetical protein